MIEYQARIEYLPRIPRIPDITGIPKNTILISYIHGKYKYVY